MQVHSMKPTMKAVANTGGMSTKPVKAWDMAGTVKASVTVRLSWCVRPAGIGESEDI